MGVLDAYQDSIDTALRVMDARPLEPEAPAKQSAWKMPYSSVGDYVRNQLTIPRALAAGAAEVAGNVMDTAGAFGQVAAASGGLTPGFDPDAAKNRNATVEAYDKLKTEGINWRTDEAQQAYKFGADLRPDPLTAGTAENIVFGLTKGLTKAIGAAATLGPVGGATAFGVSEGLTTAEDLANQGVDQETRTKVGAVTGAMSAAGVVLPVAGKTLAQTAGLVLVGGPASFMAQQQATSSILENANYGEIAKQYDPLDPVGLTVATLLPAGFAAYAKRGGFGAKPKPDVTPVSEAAPDSNVIAATPEAIDAAMVQNLTAARDAHESATADNIPVMADKDTVAGTQAPTPAGDGSTGSEKPSINQATDDYVAALDAINQIAQLSEKHGNVYVRWSAGTQFDLIEGASSRDYVSGETHSGLSAVEISANTHPADIAAALSEYMFLRMKDSSIKPYIYMANRVGTDSDSHALISPSKLLYEPSDKVISAIDRDFRIITDLAEKVAKDRSKLERLTDAFGRKIVEESLQKNIDKLDSILQKHGITLQNEQSASAGSDAAAIAPLPAVKDSFTTQTGEIPLVEPNQDVTPDAYRARVDALAKEQPDLIARLDEAGQPVKLADELAAIKKQAQEGTDTDFGALDAPLLKTAIECALSLGAA